MAYAQVGLVLEHLEERFLVRPEACDAPNDGSPIDSTAGGSIHGLMVEAGVEEGAGQTVRARVLRLRVDPPRACAAAEGRPTTRVCCG
jgi:hypothetical protein